MAQLVKVANVSEVSPGTMRTVEVKGQRIILINLGRIYAVDAHCPHRQGPLEKGHLRGDIIECPWHYYRYDIKTGKNLYPRNVYPADLTYLERDLQPLRHYRVQIEGKEVWVEL